MIRTFFSFLVISMTIPACLAQQDFINLSIDEVREYWELQISSEYFNEGTWDDTGEEFFMINIETAGTPLFSATFGADGLCESHTFKIYYEDISVIQTRLMKSGYVYSQKDSKWINEDRGLYWKIDGPFGDHYLIECKKFE